MMKRKDFAACIYHTEDKVLLQHRTRDALHRPGVYTLFGGGLEQGESPTEAFFREKKEELACTLLGRPAFFARYPYREEIYGRYGIQHIWRAALVIGAPISITEGQGFGLYTREQLLHMDVVPYHKDMLIRDWEHIFRAYNELL